MNRVKELRERRQMTQEEFADFCGISRSSIARYDAGEKISRANAEKIASVCRVSVDYVLGISAEETVEPYDDLMEYLDELRRSPDMRMLFSTARNVKPEHIRAAVAMLKSFEPEEGSD